MDPLQCAVAVPAGEIVVHRALRRQVLGHVLPLAASAQDVEDAVDDLPDVHLALASAGPGGRDQRLNVRPFLIGHVTRVAQPCAVVAGAVLGRPHAAPCESMPIIESNGSNLFKPLPLTDSDDSQSFRMDT